MSDRERVARSWLIDIVEDEPEGAYMGRSSYDHEGASAALAELDRLSARVAELEAAEFRLRTRMAREADSVPERRYLWIREIVDLLSGRIA